MFGPQWDLAEEPASRLGLSRNLPKPWKSRLPLLGLHPCVTGTTSHSKLSQDSILEMTENSQEKITYDHLKPDADFEVNKPFLFIIEMNHDILAMGKIKDPTW